MILLNDFKRMWADLESDLTDTFKLVGSSGWYILGPEVERFENEIKTWFGCSYAIGCGNGLDAITISFKVLGARSGDKFITTPLSAFATTLAGIKLGLVPVFCDVDDSGNIDLDIVESILKEESIRFIVPVHLYGSPLNLKRLSEIRNKYDVLIIEDCAQAIGACYNGIPVGSVGHMSATSFYPTKNLGAFGDGGAVLTSNSDFARVSRVIRDYGQSEKYVHSCLGENSRLDEVQAALLSRTLLPRLSGWNRRRQDIAKYYDENITNSLLIKHSHAQEVLSVHHLYPLRVEKRSDFMNHLHSNGIASGIHYPHLIPDQPVMENVRFEIKGDLKIANEFASREVSLPIHPWLTDSELERVVHACNSWQV